MAPARLAPSFLGLLSPLLAVLLASGAACQSEAVKAANINCKLIDGANEVNGECVCKNPDDFIDASYTKCISVAYNGILTECEDTRQCYQRMGQGALCKNGACACAEGFHYLHGVCWPTRDFGESCEADAECFAYAESDAYACVDGICACAPGALAIRKAASPICRRIAQAGEECESDVECVEGYICKKVTRPTTSLNYVCTKGNRNIISRHASKQTLVNVTNSRGITQKSKQVIPATEVESPCGTNEELTPSGAACVCKPGFFKATADSSCLPELGEPCAVGEAVSHITYGACRRSAKFSYDSSTNKIGVLTCLGGFVADPQNRICEKTRKVTFNCLIDSQCAYYGGYCSDKKCRCEEGYHYDSEKLVCWVTKGLHEECELDSDCGVTTEDSVECTNTLCQCKTSYHQVENDCIKDGNKIGDSCREASDCVFAADDPKVVCDENICNCDTGYFPLDDTTCEVGINGKCQANSDCDAVPFTECDGGKCVCRDGYVKTSTSKCIPVAKEYGEECEENEQCYGLTVDEKNISCSSETNTCTCEEDYHYRNNKCWSSRSLQQNCEFQSQCIANNTVCKNNYCTCEIGYKPDGEFACKVNAAPRALSGSLSVIGFIVLASRLL